jgi:uncharacterized protein YbaR (Trm112 family)
MVTFGARLVCPHCKGTLDHSRVRWYEKWRRLLMSSRPYRCYDCRRRFWF